MRILMWTYSEPNGDHGYGSVGIREGDWASMLKIMRLILSESRSARFWWGV